MHWTQQISLHYHRFLFHRLRRTVDLGVKKKRLFRLASFELEDEKKKKKKWNLHSAENEQVSRR